jgi:hypothetical protein
MEDNKAHHLQIQKNSHEAFNIWHHRKDGLAQLCCPREQVKIMGHNLTPFKR